jgi:hypothetical protein
MSFPAPAGSPRAGAALVAGAGGRFGEALLNRVLASGDYGSVVGLAQAPMTLGVRGLSLATLEGLPPLDDIFVNLAQPGALPASFHGRDAVWTPVDEVRLAGVVRAACTAGARRLVLVAPSPVWQQIGGLHRGLSGAAELALADLPITSLTVLRPVLESATVAGHRVARLAAVYTRLQMLALPRSMPVQTSEQLARGALAAMRGARDGVRIVTADRIPELVRETAS